LKTLILKFLTSTISEEELLQLREWLQKPKNQESFKTYVRDVYNVNLAYNQVNVEQAYQKVWNTIQKEKKPIFRLNWRYAAAAILVIALASTYFFRDTIFNDQIENTTPIIVNNQIEPGEDKATLTLENGEEVTLTKGTQFQTQNAISNGEEIVYQQLSSPAPALPSGRQSRENNKPQTTNTLTIPRGGQFYIKMSDGTKVWLNSESQLKYPVSFTDGESRQVELVYGEAYFEVSPSTKHKGSDFKVVHNKQEVQVLGTAFNIKAYKDETNVYTTLAEGKVSVTPSLSTSLKTSFIEGQKLVPGQQSNLNVNANTLTISEVDVKTEIAWKDGVFNFKEKSLKDIMKVLSRWYDMEVVFENKELENVGFVGVLRKNQDIEDILSLIKSTSINNYEINNKTIILK
jgi:hypothetical protein